MAESDVNDAFNDIFLIEESLNKKGYEEGYSRGEKEGNPEGYHLGYHRGAEIGAELGYYLGFLKYHSNSGSSEKITTNLNNLIGLIEEFPKNNDEDVDILGKMDVIRGQFKKICSLLKVDGRFPERFLEPLLPLANCHMVDFFTHDVYEKFIPDQIRDELNNLDETEALNAIYDSKTFPYLNDFISKTKSHTLPSFPQVCHNLKNFETLLIESGCKTLSGLHLETFMTSKKSHEVEILSEIATAVSEIVNTTHIIDIGDGKGYLSSALAIHSQLKVLGIDASSINTNGAAQRVKKINKILGRSKTVCNEEFYKQTTRYVDESTDLFGLITEHFPERDVEVGLVGLHTCGDLAPSCLRIYTSSNRIKSICNVGCCYHLITENQNFPLSRYLRNLNFQLGRNARMVAAQSLDRMLHQKEKPSDVLFYRSLLQVYITENAPELIDIQTGRSKKITNFPDYVYKNLKKFNSELKPSEDELIRLFESYRPKMVELQIFYMLRAHLAPVIEAVILLDRLLYLHELGYENSYLVQLFDPVISPRCYGIISTNMEGVNL